MNHEAVRSGESGRRRATRLALLGAALLLASGCAASQFDENGPRNGAGELVDPVTGIVLPGVQQGGGGPD